MQDFGHPAQAEVEGPAHQVSDGPLVKALGQRVYGHHAARVRAVLLGKHLVFRVFKDLPTPEYPHPPPDPYALVGLQRGGQPGVVEPDDFNVAGVVADDHLGALPPGPEPHHRCLPHEPRGGLVLARHEIGYGVGSAEVQVPVGEEIDQFSEGMYAQLRELLGRRVLDASEGGGRRIKLWGIFLGCGLRLCGLGRRSFGGRLGRGALRSGCRALCKVGQGSLDPPLPLRKRQVLIVAWERDAFRAVLLPPVQEGVQPADHGLVREAALTLQREDFLQGLESLLHGPATVPRGPP